MRFYQTRYFKAFLVLLLSFTLVLALTSKDIYKDISQSLRLYNDVYKQVIANYVDQIKVGQFTEVGIKEMLKELDPYTTFLVEEEKESLEMMTKGEYGGVGLRISMRSDTLTVVSPIEGSPAKRAGILPGDQIIKIDSISTIGMDLDEAAKMIRGKVGTKVELTIHRSGIAEESVYILVRDQIKVQDVTYSGIIDDGIGYIKLSGFSSGAEEEISEAISKLEQVGDFNSLVLDLRGNSGGLLDEALKISEAFTEPGDTILVTKGRVSNANRVFVSRKKPIISKDMKLVVLIDRGSASASEIVSGVIQDLDRGVVIGTQSFGKGLVQTVYRLDQDHSVKVTTAKYYLPSGRLIQKPDYLKNPELVELDIPEDTIFYSQSRRKLKGGGGIIPDIEVGQPVMSPYIAELWRQNMFYTFVVKYKNENPDITTDIKIDDEVLEEFRNYLNQNHFEYYTKSEKTLRKLEKEMRDKEEYKPLLDEFEKFYTVFDSLKMSEFDSNIDLIKIGIASEIATLLEGLKGRTKVTLKDDPVVQKAIAVLKDDVSYNLTLSAGLN
jgi:carboxyl-terminal processing protease